MKIFRTDPLIYLEFSLEDISNSPFNTFQNYLYKKIQWWILIESYGCKKESALFYIHNFQLDFSFGFKKKICIGRSYSVGGI